MKIKVRVDKLYTDPESKTKAMISATLEDAYAIHNIRVVESGTNGGTFVAMPSIKNSKDKYTEIFHPISAEARETLCKEIMQAYKTALEKQSAEKSAREAEPTR